MEIIEDIKRFGLRGTLRNRWERLKFDARYHAEKLKNKIKGEEHRFDEEFHRHFRR